MTDAAECLRTLAHPHRLRIVEMLLREERHVSELVAACGISQPACSVHLKMLRDRGIVVADRRGRRVFYSIAEPGVRAIIDCIRGRFYDTIGEDQLAATPEAARPEVHVRDITAGDREEVQSGGGRLGSHAAGNVASSGHADGHGNGNGNGVSHVRVLNGHTVGSGH